MDSKEKGITVVARPTRRERGAQYKGLAGWLGADIGIVPQISADVGKTALIGQQRCVVWSNTGTAAEAWEEDSQAITISHTV